MLRLLTWISGYYAAFVFYLGMQRPYGTWGPPRISAVALSMVLGGLAFWIWRLHKRISQAMRNKGASELVASVTTGASKGEPASFALYLRPFLVTESLPVAGPGAEAHPAIPAFYREHALDLEEVLADTLQGRLLLQGLGSPDDMNVSLGSGRAAVPEAKWKEVVSALASQAYRVILIPSAQLGTFWEIMMLKERGLLPKTIFLMAPATEEMGQSPQLNWDQAKSLLNDHGIELSPYNSAGALLTLTESGRTETIEPFRRDPRRGLKRAMKKVAKLGARRVGASTYQQRLAPIAFRSDRKYWQASLRRTTRLALPAVVGLVAAGNVVYSLHHGWSLSSGYGFEPLWSAILVPTHTYSVSLWVLNNTVILLPFGMLMAAVLIVARQCFAVGPVFPFYGLIVTVSYGLVVAALADPLLAALTHASVAERFLPRVVHEFGQFLGIAVALNTVLLFSRGQLLRLVAAATIASALGWAIRMGMPDVNFLGYLGEAVFGWPLVIVAALMAIRPLAPLRYRTIAWVGALAVLAFLAGGLLGIALWELELPGGFTWFFAWRSPAYWGLVTLVFTFGARVSLRWLTKPGHGAERTSPPVAV